MSRPTMNPAATTTPGVFFHNRVRSSQFADVAASAVRQIQTTSQSADTEFSSISVTKR